MIERSVIFVTGANIESLLLECSFDGSAWTLANLYLASVGAELLGKTAPHLVGLSEETTCYVSPEYFLSQDEPLDDFVVHEAAHIFHNCKRAIVGLRQTRRKEWLLDIEYRKRETFAYSCEAYTRVIERGKNPVSAARSRTNTPAPHASQMNARTLLRSQASSRRLPRLGTAGSSSSGGAHQTAARRHALRKLRARF